MKYTGIWDLLIHETAQLYSTSAILEKKKKKAMVELEGGRLLTEDISLAPYSTQNHPTPASCLDPSVPHSRSSVVSLRQIPKSTVTEMASCSLLV